eukprot:TRINITY_DN9558_c0_g1_i1.p1 TRINITY_DN9558_c0_g1~~TRINITY_DN9558_c0_g1_i1.p1  ORF type:complete len:562 (-),score=15.19 TRINITY_DN9558_c0_g1_i1:166-1851(-)
MYMFRRKARMAILFWFLAETRSEHIEEYDDVSCLPSNLMQADLSLHSLKGKSTHRAQPSLSHVAADVRPKPDARVPAVTSDRLREMSSRSSSNSDVWTAPCITFMVASIAYAASCVVYSFRLATDEKRSAPPTAAMGPSNVQIKARHTEWDYIRLFGHALIVYGHFGLAYLTKARPSLIKESWYQWAFNFPVGFLMALFALMSGIFGQSVSRSVLCKMLCYTFGTAYLSTMLDNLIECISSGTWNLHRLVPSPVMETAWYLGALGIWRLVISPMFSIALSRGVTRAVPFSAACCLFYACWHVVPRFFDLPFLDLFCNEDVFSLAPFFAFGQLAPLVEWTSYLRDARLSALGAMYVLAWYSGLFISASFRAWNQVACLGPRKVDVSGVIGSAEADIINTQLCISDRHFPHSFAHSTNGFSVEHLQQDIVNYFLKGSITLAVMLTVAGVPRIIMRFAPKLHQFLADCGTRAFYGYVLHWIYFHIGDCAGFSRLANVMPPAFVPPYCLAVAIFTVLILTSALTERLFSWMVMPLWLMNVFTCPAGVPRQSPPAEALVSVGASEK